VPLSNGIVVCIISTEIESNNEIKTTWPTSSYRPGQTMHYKGLFSLKWYPSAKPLLIEIEMEAYDNYDNAIDKMPKSIKLDQNGAATNTIDRALRPFISHYSHHLIPDSGK
ncbi:surface protein, partial [Striga asiatica]